MGQRADLAERLSSRHSLSARLQAFRVRKGWNMDRLATSAGVSRTTVYHLERGDIAKPRASTLYKLAVALGIDPSDLAVDSSPIPLREDPGLQGHDDTDQALRSKFDRKTNTYIKSVYDDNPPLFQHWGHDDWDELYSTFGVGGAPNEQGVLEIADKINSKRETLQKLQVVLETHHASVAKGLIDNLFQLIQAEAENAANLGPLAADSQPVAPPASQQEKSEK